MNSFKTLLTAALFTSTFTLSTFAAADGPNSTPVHNEADQSVIDINPFVNAWSAGNPLADLNKDGSVDGADLELFFDAINHPKTRADTDGNGRIDGNDFAMFLAAWISGDPDADLNQDGGIDGSDLEEWQKCADSLTLDFAIFTAGEANP